MFVVCLYVFFVVSLSSFFLHFALMYLSLDEGAYLPSTSIILHVIFISIVNQRRAKCQIRIVANGTLMVIKSLTTNLQHNIHTTEVYQNGFLGLVSEECRC